MSEVQYTYIHSYHRLTIPIAAYLEDDIITLINQLYIFVTLYFS